MLFQDLTGQKFYKLTVLSHEGKGNNGQSKWLCECECGNTKIVFAHHMKSGNVQSCGCLAKGEPRRQASIRHGWTGTPEYESYNAAKKRCNPDHKDEFKAYAERGIEFRFSDFVEFINHIGPRPEPKFDYSLDRIDNNGHYEVGNVKWSTKLEQARNRRCDNCLALKERIKQLEEQLASNALTSGCSY